MTTYTLAGGCFWCLDAVFAQLNGVESVISGYSGGTAEDANYYRVMTGRTGHRESVQVTFDENILPAEVLLDIYFLIHDPTSLDRQGNDAGPQYRSVMFYQDEQQKADFTAALARAANVYDQPIVTELSPLNGFYEAEADHQDFYNQNPAQPYCMVVVEPKIQKARAQYAKYMKGDH